MYSRDEVLMALEGLCHDYERLSGFAEQMGAKAVYNPEAIFKMVEEWFDAFPETEYDKYED